MQKKSGKLISFIVTALMLVTFIPMFLMSASAAGAPKDETNLGVFHGGIVGYNEGVITDCEATGTFARYNFGGIAGHNRATISNSYYTGSTQCNIVCANEGIIM